MKKNLRTVCVEEKKGTFSLYITMWDIIMNTEHVGTVKIAEISFSRLIIGGNPFSGFSHQGPDRDAEMAHYYTTEKIKETLRQAEQLGISTFLGRVDNHIMRILLEYWDQGGAIQWIAQALDINGSVDDAIKRDAKACYVHGGVMDHFLANNELVKMPAVIDRIRNAGLAAGIAGHNPAVFEYARENLDVDFYMCSYYNPTPRDENPEHVSTDDEVFSAEDRQKMIEVIATLKKPVIHYKIIAAGRNDPQEAFAFTVRHMKANDAVCVGVYTKDNRNILEENVHLLANAIKQSDNNSANL